MHFIFQFVSSAHSVKTSDFVLIQTLPSSPAGDVVLCSSSGLSQALINGFVSMSHATRRIYQRGHDPSFNSTFKQDEISPPDLLFPLPSSSPSLSFCNHSFEPLIQLSARCSPTSSGVTSYLTHRRLRSQHSFEGVTLTFQPISKSWFLTVLLTLAFSALFTTLQSQRLL